MAVAGLVLAALPLSAAVALPAGVLVVLVTLIRPQFSLYLLVFSVPFSSLRSLSLGGLSVTASELLVALVAVAWLARSVARRSVRPAHGALLIPLLLLLGAELLSLFDALSLSLAFGELLKWAEVLAVYVVATSILTASDRTAGPGASSRRIVAMLSLLILLAGLLEALLGVYQFLLRAGPEGFLIGRFLRAYGTFAQPNPYAGYLNHSLPLGFALFVARVDSLRGRSRSLPVWLPVLALAAWLVVVGAALLMSLSRGAWLGLALGVAGIILLYSRRSAAVALAASALLAAVLILAPNILPSALTSRFSSITDYFRLFDVQGVEVTDENFAVVERMAHWQAGWEMFSDRPWLGYGIGNYPAAYPRYSIAPWTDPLGHAHNVPLNFAAETGVVGLAAYLLFVAAALWTCLRAVQGLSRSTVEGSLWEWLESSAFARAVALGVLGVLLAKLTHEMLDNLWVHGMGIHIALLLAMVEGAGRGRTPPRGVPNSS